MGIDDTEVAVGVPISEEQLLQIRKDEAIRFFDLWTDKKVKIAKGPNVTDFIGLIAVPKDSFGKFRTFPFLFCSDDISQQLIQNCSFFWV